MITKFGMAVMARAVMPVAGSSVSYAQTGSVHITVTKAGFIVGDQ
jgi:hypothetical protein